MDKPTVADLMSDSDKCYICLSPFEKQAVASVENCQHVFCLECILQWSQVNKHLTCHSIYVSPVSKRWLKQKYVFKFLSKRCKNPTLAVRCLHDQSNFIYTSPFKQVNMQFKVFYD